MPRMTFAQAVARLKDLADQEGKSAWEMGDIALEMVPMGTDGAHNGADDRVRVLADAAGIDPTVLRQRRTVSHTFAPGTRVPGVSWSVYRELLNVEPDERERLLTVIRTEEPETVSGRWTVSAVRVRMGLTAILHVSEPVSDHVQRATTEERATIFQTLGRDPNVVAVARERETQREQEFTGRIERIKRDDPVSQALDASKALMDLEKAMSDFVREVASIFPRIKGMPDPKTDPWARHLFMNQLLARSQGAVDQIRALLETGKPGGDIDNFLRDVLASAEEKGGR